MSIALSSLFLLPGLRKTQKWYWFMEINKKAAAHRTHTASTAPPTQYKTTRINYYYEPKHKNKTYNMCYVRVVSFAYEYSILAYIIHMDTSTYI